MRSSSNTVENSNAIVAKLKKRFFVPDGFSAFPHLSHRASSHEETRAFRVCFDNLLGLSARSILQQACGHMRNILVRYSPSLSSTHLTLSCIGVREFEKGQFVLLRYATISKVINSSIFVVRHIKRSIFSTVQKKTFLLSV